MGTRNTIITKSEENIEEAQKVIKSIRRSFRARGWIEEQITVVNISNEIIKAINIIILDEKIKLSDVYKIAKKYETAESCYDCGEIPLYETHIIINYSYNILNKLINELDNELKPLMDNKSDISIEIKDFIIFKINRYYYSININNNNNNKYIRPLECEGKNDFLTKLATAILTGGYLIDDKWQLVDEDK